MAQGSICESKREPVFTPHAGVQPPKLTGSCKIEDAQAPSAVTNGISPTIFANAHAGPVSEAQMLSDQ
jgi:hypothetical protein